MRCVLEVNLNEVKPHQVDAVQSTIVAMLKQKSIKGEVKRSLVCAPTGDVVVYTDGGCKGGIGAWACHIKYPTGEALSLCEADEDTTNNRMEMLAVIRALEAIEIGLPIVVVLDSEYVAKGVLEWSSNWVRNGWCTREGKPVINKDLWLILLQLYGMHNVSFKLVRGHTGVAGNELVDKLCTEAMRVKHKEVIANAI